MNMKNIEQKLRHADYKQAKLYFFCNFIALMIITAYGFHPVFSFLTGISIHIILVLFKYGICHTVFVDFPNVRNLFIL